MLDATSGRLMAPCVSPATPTRLAQWVYPCRRRSLIIFGVMHSRGGSLPNGTNCLTNLGPKSNFRLQGRPPNASIGRRHRIGQPKVTEISMFELRQGVLGELPQEDLWFTHHQWNDAACCTVRSACGTASSPRSRPICAIEGSHGYRKRRIPKPTSQIAFALVHCAPKPSLITLQQDLRCSYGSLGC